MTAPIALLASFPLPCLHLPPETPPCVELYLPESDKHLEIHLLYFLKGAHQFQDYHLNSIEPLYDGILRPSVWVRSKDKINSLLPALLGKTTLVMFALRICSPRHMTNSGLFQPLSCGTLPLSHLAVSCPLH